MSQPDITRRTALLWLAAITAIGAWMRFYNLGWGAPYYHFHIDEHFVLASADMLQRDPHEAAMSPKYFMYTPLLPYFINIVRSIYETFAHQLNLSVPSDEVIYTVFSRGISAAFGTATIPVVYAIGARLAGRLAGLLSAFFLAFAVLHLRDSHFAATDIIMTFFSITALWAALRLVTRGDWSSLILCGITFGAAIISKYTGVFVLGVIGLAYFLAPGRPAPLQPISAWIRWALRGIVPIPIGLGIFAALFPLAWQYPDKFRADIKEWVVDPLSGATKPIWLAQFADVRVPELFWFTNLLWWSLGPALEILGLAGVVWLLIKWDRRAAVVASFPIIYFIAAGRTMGPVVRYAVPLMPALALTAGAASIDWLRHPRWYRPAAVVVGITVLTTGVWAAAYMNVFRQPDSRVEASRWMHANVPRNTDVLIEPSQNTPPLGSYFTDPDFGRDYVLWGPPRTNPDRHDYYKLHTIDGYRALYNRGPSDEDRRNYIAGRLALADWIVMDDSFVQWYEHLPSPDHDVMKAYYRDLFDGKLGFTVVKTFKTYPRIFGVNINDDAAEMTFRLFDHPRVYILRRFSR